MFYLKFCTSLKSHPFLNKKGEQKHDLKSGGEEESAASYLQGQELFLTSQPVLDPSRSEDESTVLNQKQAGILSHICKM